MNPLKDGLSIRVYGENGPTTRGSCWSAAAVVTSLLSQSGTSPVQELHIGKIRRPSTAPPPHRGGASFVKDPCLRKKPA